MISTVAGVIVFLLTSVVAGHVAVSLIVRRERWPWPERIGLTLAIGPGLVGILMFWVSLAGFQPTRVVILLVFGIFAVVQAELLRRDRGVLSIQPGANGIPTDAFSLGALIIIAGCILATVVNALALPVYEWDSFAIWAFKAKVVALGPLNPRPDYFQDVSLSYSHLDYPLLVPFLMAGVYGSIGHISDQLGKIVFPLWQIAFAFQLFSALRWKLERVESFILTAIGISVPTLVRWSGAGVADPVLLLYELGTIVYILKWREDGNRSDLLFSILFGVFLAFTKNEGTAIVLVIAGVMLIFSVAEWSRRQLSGSLLFVTAMLALHTPWLWWSWTIPRTHENYGARLNVATVIENWNRLGAILSEFLSQIWAWQRWGGIWLVLLLATVCGWRAFVQRGTIILWMLLLAQTVLYIIVLMVTPWDLRELLDSALDRLLLPATPLAVLLIGAHWRATTANGEKMR